MTFDEFAGARLPAVLRFATALLSARMTTDCLPPTWIVTLLLPG